jgi:hypothetical protein
MEFQNANNNVAGEKGNNNNKQTYVCYCGCGLTFISGVELGFGLKTNAEEYIYEHKIDGINWNVYISEEFIKTWGDFMNLLENSFRNDSNNRIWFHLHAYVQERHLVVDDMPLEFIYMN